MNIDESKIYKHTDGSLSYKIEYYNQDDELISFRAPIVTQEQLNEKHIQIPGKIVVCNKNWMAYTWALGEKDEYSWYELLFTKIRKRPSNDLRPKTESEG